MNEDMEKKLTSVLESLQDKEELITSSKGNVAAYVDGLGNVKKVILNKDLDELNKEDLEKEILEMFDLIKKQASYNVMNAITKDGESDEEETNNVS